MLRPEGSHQHGKLEGNRPVRTGIRQHLLRKAPERLSGSLPQREKTVRPAEYEPDDKTDCRNHKTVPPQHRHCQIQAQKQTGNQ